jgi:hypothetical protein
LYLLGGSLSIFKPIFGSRKYKLLLNQEVKETGQKFGHMTRWQILTVLLQLSSNDIPRAA